MITLDRVHRNLDRVKIKQEKPGRKGGIQFIFEDGSVEAYSYEEDVEIFVKEKMAVVTSEEEPPDFRVLAELNSVK